MSSRSSIGLFARIIFSFVVLAPSLAFASSALTITNVVASVPGSSKGHQYIEVTNTGSEAIDLGAEDIRLVDHRGRHYIKSLDGASMLLAPGAHVVIAQKPDIFRADKSGYSGLVLKSSFSLTKSGDVSVEQKDGTVLASKSYISTKPSSGTRGSSKSKKVSTYNSHTAYDPGMNAPTASADAAAVGALPISPEVLAFIDTLFSNVWFAGILGLLAFSGFSLMVIKRRHATTTSHTVLGKQPTSHS